MPRYWLRLSSVSLLCLTTILMLISALSRLQNSGAVLEYQRFWPSSDIIWANYADVDHNLNVSLEQFMLVTAVDPNDTSADGRHVRSIPTPGNVDLYLTHLDGTEFRLTQFGDFPPDRFGADARRSNLFPRWSADNAWIAFLSADGSGKTDVYVIRPDSHDLRLIGERIISQIPLRPRWVNLIGVNPTQTWALLAVLGAAVIGAGAFYCLWRVQ